MKLASVILLSFGSLLEAQTTASLIIAPRSGTSTDGTLIFRGGTAASAKTLTFRLPGAGLTSSYNLYWPVAQASAGQYLQNDGLGNLSWQTVTSGGGGGVTSVTATAPINSSGGSTPVISCPNCMRLDANNTPTGAYNIGSTGAWWNAMYSGTFQVPVSGCVNAAYVSGTSLLGGQIFIKNGSCVVQAQMDSNGFDTVGTVGSYRIQGTQVIDASRNATFNNLTILGTCIGCGGGGGAGVSNVTATYPITSSGGSTPNIACTNCMRMGSGDINVPNFNVEIGTSANWISKLYAQNHYSPNGVCADAALMTSTALFGGQIYIKNGSCAVQAQLNSNGFDTVGTVGRYSVQGTTAIDASRGASFTSVTSSGNISVTGAANIEVNGTGAYKIGGATGNTKSITLGACTMLFNGGILVGNAGC